MKNTILVKLNTHEKISIKNFILVFEYQNLKDK